MTDFARRAFHFARARSTFLLAPNLFRAVGNVRIEWIGVVLCFLCLHRRSLYADNAVSVPNLTRPLLHTQPAPNDVLLRRCETRA